MNNRKQRRQKAVLPLRVIVRVAGKTLLGHTVDISASGARVVLSDEIAPGSVITVEFRHRRSSGTAVWCRPRNNSKYDHEVGIHLLKPGASFWGVNLPLHEGDEPRDLATISVSQFMDTTSDQV